jgi:oligopeptide transport system substrate-binding protein
VDKRLYCNMPLCCLDTPRAGLPAPLSNSFFAPIISGRYPYVLRSHKRKVKIVASVLSLAFAIVVPGCPSKSGGAGGKNILRYALQSPPTRLDPAQVEDGDTIDMLQQVFEGLVMWSDKNEVVPNIAEKWDISPDGTVYTFKLRDNVKFHNGRKLTAADLVYSFTRTLADKKSGTAMTYMNDIVGAKDLHDGKVN